MNFDLDRIREKLSNVDAVALLAVLGIFAGLISGIIILLFRSVIDITLTVMLPESSENFEGLPLLMHGALPLTGAAMLGAGFHYLTKEQRRTGIGYVIERFNLNQGSIGLKSLVIQFVGAAVTLISGLSMGREGPAVHLGAAGGSLLGQWARLPNNSIRVLTGCGCAAAISTSFNTPIAGVIFAMEVIMMEYSISTFIPIILASVVGASLTRAVYGHEPAFAIPEVQLGSLIELPFIVICGIVTGCLAAALIYLSKQCYLQTKSWEVGWRFLLAGVITALCGMLAPQILGIGYDTVDTAMIGALPILSLLMIMVLKTLASGACIGLGLPGGSVGPLLVIGAMAGGLFGELLQSLMPNQSNVTLYVLLGMAGMMAATLEAPLAALMTLLELTFEANIIFPGMLVVVIASLVTGQLFRQRGIFLSLLEAQGITLRVNPLNSHLQSAGVASVMDRNISRVKPTLSAVEAHDQLKKKPNWLLIEHDGLPTHFLPAADLASYLTAQEAEGDLLEDSIINLLEIPAKRDNVSPILLSATLQEALDIMNSTRVDALYVRRMSAPNIYRVFGILRRQDIEYFYQH